MWLSKGPVKTFTITIGSEAHKTLTRLAHWRARILRLGPGAPPIFLDSALLTLSLEFKVSTPCKSEGR